MMDPELKKALDAMARTFSAPVFEGTEVWHWAYEYRGEKPPVWVYDEALQRWMRENPSIPDVDS